MHNIIKYNNFISRKILFGMELVLVNSKRIDIVPNGQKYN